MATVLASNCVLHFAVTLILTPLPQCQLIDLTLQLLLVIQYFVLARNQLLNLQR